MGKVKFDFSELEEFSKKLEKAGASTQTFIEDANNEIALRLLSKVIKKTQPGVYSQNSGKVGGTLRGGWGADKVQKRSVWSGEVYATNLTNETYYASYVEYGHRTVVRKDGTRGYVEGRFYLTKSEKEVSAITESLVKKRAENYLNRQLF